MTKIKLTKATEKDCRFIWQLRNSPDVRKVSINKEKIPYENHKKWFKNHYSEFYIIDKHKGYLRFNIDDYVSIAIVKDYRKKGLGIKILKSIKKGKAIILLDNEKSLNAFLRAGFKLKGFYLEKNG